MKKTLMLLCIFIPVVLNAQTRESISFRTIQSFQKVLEQAKKEDKIIFIDAYATWCGPCKKMDAEVYTNAKIGNYVNKNFIAIKVQFDQTVNDRQEIKAWYEDAKTLMKNFQIGGFPTYLFLSPEGKLLERNMGYYDVESFLGLLKKASDPKLNYAGQVRDFNAGTLTDSTLISLAFRSKENHYDSLAEVVAKAYKQKVIDKASPEKIINPKLLRFLNNFNTLFTTEDKVIQFFYINQKLTDSLFGVKNAGIDFTNIFIYRELILPALRPNGKLPNTTPNWAALTKRISKQYDHTLADKSVRNAKLEWYSKKNDWQNTIKYTIEKYEIEGLDTVGLGKIMLNNFCYGTIFLHSEDPKVLKKGSDYMKMLLKTGPDVHFWLDTYANLQYKLGNKEVAIENEELALALAEKQKNQSSADEYRTTLDKMFNNVATWK